MLVLEYKSDLWVAQSIFSFKSISYIEFFWQRRKKLDAMYILSILIKIFTIAYFYIYFIDKVCLITFKELTHSRFENLWVCFDIDTHFRARHAVRMITLKAVNINWLILREEDTEIKVGSVIIEILTDPLNGL